MKTGQRDPQVTAGFPGHETEDDAAWWRAWKERIASELGVIPGAETTARANGSIGGEMTKRMVGLAEANLSDQPIDWDGTREEGI